ncbi:hypothetical protein ATO12_17865 [Aquimarina atlantica]|uniref:RiboL-PSP-HEPN domain-containing protein n=1 Tax=Aquimarina atlantica TaxID=1317122 RepID=A0A023BUZ5_9FLAO|nr:HEPN domain-containing protein [Aquimarina atlantica]EZH73800.1 hypothetical protein ATO12_17865 [Aquimarina atlantica]
MIGHTESFKNLKKEQQRILDFTVLVCYAVPNLKKSIKGFKEKVPNYEKLANPDYFKETADIGRLESLSGKYKENLSKYTLLSAFSFFESYFRDVVNELIEFHGGKSEFIETVKNRHRTFLQNQNSTIIESKKKLNEPLKKIKWEKYQKHIKILDDEPNYRHPSELLATYGLKYFIESVVGNGFKSVMIPEILEYGLGLDMSEKVNKHPDLIDKNLKETFDIMRDLRNSIGHGNPHSIGFEKVMDLIRFLRHFSLKIDEHLTNNFFILERSR